MRLQFSRNNIYGHAAEGAPILRLRLTVRIQKLKSSKHKSLEYKYTLQ